MPPVWSGWTWFPAAACQHLPPGLSGAALTFTPRLGCVSATANEQKLWKARWPCPSGVSQPSWKCNFWVLSPDLWLSGLEASHFTSVPQQRRGASSACCFCWLFSDLSGKEQFTAGTALTVCLQSTVRVYDAIKRPCSVINHNMLCISSFCNGQTLCVR